MRILLLEDEEAIRGFVRINLKRNGMEVTEADNGETALALAESEGPFEIALLDVMLPTISGFEVCEKLRERYPQMGIIMLTAKSQEEDKIYGLELGADDYVQKPFSPGELIARIKSLLRRMRQEPFPSLAERAEAEPGPAAGHDGGAGEAPGPAAGQSGGAGEAPGPAAGQSGGAGEAPGPAAGQSGGAREAPGPAAGQSGDAAEAPGLAAGTSHAPGGVPFPAAEASEGAAFPAREAAPAAAQPPLRPGELRIGRLTLSIPERKLWKDAREIILTPTEFTLVRLLMEREGISVSRDDILSEVWGRYYVGDLKVVDVNIRRIRQKLEDNPSEPQIIETVWGFGYRWKRSRS